MVATRASEAADGAAGGRARWVVLGTAVLAQAAFAAVTTGIATLAPLLRARLDLDMTTLGTVLSASSVGMMLTLYAWGALSDRVGGRVVVAAGLAGVGLALTLVPDARDAGALSLALGLAGASGAAVYAPTSRAVGQWFSPRERGLALGIQQTAVPIGAAAASATFPAVSQTWGLSGSIWSLTWVCAAGSVASACFLRERSARRPRHRRPSARLLGDACLRRVVAGSAFLMVVLVAVLGYLVVFLHDARGVSWTVSGLLLASVQVGGAAVRVAAGRVSDVSGGRIAALRVVAAATAAVLAVAAVGLALSDAVVVPLLVAASALALGWSALPIAWIVDAIGEERRGATLGAFVTVLNGAAAAGVFAFGALADVGSWRLAWGALAACAALGWVVLRRVPDARTRERALAAPSPGIP